MAKGKKEGVPHEGVGAREAELLRKIRMAAIAEIAATVSHELGNFLGALATCLQLLRRNPQLTREDREVLDIIEAGSQRLGGFVSDLSVLGDLRPPHLQRVDLHELIDETLAHLQAEALMPSSIAIRREFDPCAQRVRVDPEQMRQLFRKLFTIAAQEMRADGELRVRTQGAGGRVKLWLQDTGVGIPTAGPPQVLDASQGSPPRQTGLGWAVLHRLVEDHGGEIWIGKESGTGICFVIAFPTERS